MGLFVTFQICDHQGTHLTHICSPGVFIEFVQDYKQTNLIFDVHVVYCSEANRNKGHDAVLDPHAVGGEGDEQADLASHGGGKVALDELEDGEDDDGDDKEPREENPVELVEEAKVVAAVDDKATFSVEDHCGSEETIFNHIESHHCCTYTGKAVGRAM